MLILSGIMFLMYRIRGCGPGVHKTTLQLRGGAERRPRRMREQSAATTESNTPPLNGVNVHCSAFKALPLVRAAICLDKSLEGERRAPGGEWGTVSGGVPHCVRRSAQAWTCAIGAGPSAIRAAAARNGLLDLDLFAGANFLELRKAEVQLRSVPLLGTSVNEHWSSAAGLP